MNPRVLALLLRPSRGQWSVIALPAIAFALVTTLVLGVIGGAQKFWSWTDPDAGLYQGDRTGAARGAARDARWCRGAAIRQAPR